MLINSINKCIQQSFLTTSLKNISSKSWAALAILAFSSFVIGHKYSCFFVRKAVALWNKNESSTTTKVNQVASSVSLDKKPFEIVLDQWIKEDPDRIQAQKRILEFSSTYSEETHLNLVSLELTSLPDIFHLEPFLSKLKQLNLSKNSLKCLPESFGNLEALTILDLTENSLINLPKSFDNQQALITQLLTANGLTSLSEYFQEIIGIIHPTEALISLPKSFGNLQSLTTLELSYNRILSGLPMQIINLPPTCIIDLSRCNLSQTILERILEITTDLMYAGPHISFSISDRVHSVEKSIKESLKDLHSIADKSLINFSNLKKTSTLRSWLHRLSDIADYKKQGSLQKALANKIIEYLNQANESLGFREIFYNIIQNAAETRGDRMSLSVLHLGIAYKLAIIDLKDMKKLSDFLKSVWAIELLEEIARNKIPALPFFDEIEVYLGYPIKLKEALNLPVDVQEMLYFPCSALKDKDLQEAKDLVLSKQGNQEAYFAFLIGHDKWKEALSFNYTEEYQAILNKKIDASELENPDYSTIEEKYNQELIELTKKALS